MLFEDTYYTIKKPCEGVFKDKGSKFIAFAYPINKEADTKSLMQLVKTEHPKARHYCWAWRLSTDKANFKINDDGEPSGTAGRPILNTLLSKELTNIFIVVVRYFGGTLLGVPGLIYAYKSATLEAIKNAEIVQKTINDIYEINFDYIYLNEVMRIIKEEQLLTKEQLFNNKCYIKLEIQKSLLSKVLGKFEKIYGLKSKYLITV